MDRLPEAFLRRPIAHRALHDVGAGRPENSRAAIEAAIAHGYGIEIDLQLSRDDQAVVFHDYDLDRLTDATGRVRDRSAADLQTIGLTHGREGIPTFAEVLDLVAGQVPLLVEVKDQDGAFGANVGPLEAATAAALAAYQGPVAVMSFNPHSVALFKELLPDVPRGITTRGFDETGWPISDEVLAGLRDIADYERVGACFISHHHVDLSRPRVAQLRAAGADVLCWTIRSEAEAHAAGRIAQNITFEGYLPA